MIKTYLPANICKQEMSCKATYPPPPPDVWTLFALSTF